VTTAQLISVALLVAVAVWAYLPSVLNGISLPTSKPQVLKDIESVVRIRNSSRTPEVVTACNQLLAVLLQVKP
jgi:hypothetical protein